MRSPRFTLRVLAIAVWLQFKLLRLEGIIFTVVVPPVLYTIVLVLVVQHAGRTDLAAYAVLGPAVLGAWGVAVGTSGHVVTEDRWNGTLELVLIAPGGGWLVFFGRVLATSVVSLIAIAETIAVARLMGMSLDIRDPGLFAVAVAATVVSVAAAGLITAATYVLARETRLFTNVLAFPLIMLSGAAFPIALLPEPGQWLSEIISLKWGAQLLRAAVGAEEPNVAVALVMMGVLTAAYVIIGRAVFSVVERRVRYTGTLSSYD